MYTYIYIYKFAWQVLNRIKNKKKKLQKIGTKCTQKNTIVNSNLSFVSMKGYRAEDVAEKRKIK